MNRLRQSFSWWCFENRGVPAARLLKEAKTMGYHGVDLLPEGLWDQAREAGLIIVNGSGPRPLEKGFNHREHHAPLQEQLSRQLEFAAQYQVPLVTVFAGNRERLSDEEGLTNTVLGLQKVVPLAEQKGITLILELLNSKIDHPDHQCDRTAWAVAVCQLVNSPNLKLLYDIYHMQVQEGNVTQVLTTNIEYIGHVHTAGVPGRADIDETQELYYPAIIRALGKAGYRGYIAHEFLPRGEPLAALRRAYEICDISID
jgi:hydroxypyruvate isomerase